MAGFFAYKLLLYIFIIIKIKFNRSGLESMTIGDIIRKSDPCTYSKLMKIGKKSIEHKKKIKLGDSAENLMKADGYKRVGGALRQRHWGT